MSGRLKQFFANFSGGFLSSLLHKKNTPEETPTDGNHIARNDAKVTQITPDSATPIHKDTVTTASFGTAHSPVHITAPVLSIDTVRQHAVIRQAIKKLDVLPAMPIIAQRLLALNPDTEEGERLLLVLIAQDPQISAKILGLANSAMISAARKISTVREASILLGTKRIQSIATSIAILSLMSKAPAGEFNIHDLWLHSFRVAFAMQGIARSMPPDLRPHEEQIFLAGLLHDIGFLVQAYIDPKLSDKLHNHFAAQPERPIREIEQEVLEICHDELGAELALHWNLPEEIVAVIRYHHFPDVAEATVGQPLVRMVNIAERLLPTIGLLEYAPSDIRTEEWEALGIDPSLSASVKAQVDEQDEQALQFVNSFV